MFMHCNVLLVTSNPRLTTKNWVGQVMNYLDNLRVISLESIVPIEIYSTESQSSPLHSLRALGGIYDGSFYFSSSTSFAK